jgi:hypothetical protein
LGDQCFLCAVLNANIFDSFHQFSCVGDCTSVAFGKGRTKERSKFRAPI